MPIRLPSRHRVESKAETTFRRRSPPTPQATRLMKISLGAGLLFILVLAAVFVPKGLQYDRPSNPLAVLGLRSSGPFVVEVVRVNVELPLAEFRAELNVTGAGQSARDVNINPLAEGAWPAPPGTIVSFDDADANGQFSAGDTFTIQPQANYTSYRILVFHVSGFVNPQPPCPCAAARIEFTA